MPEPTRTLSEPSPAATPDPTPARPEVPTWRRLAARATTALAATLVVLVLVVPTEVGRLAPVAFLRIPVEGLLAVALLLVLRGRARRGSAIAMGVALGLFGIVKMVDVGFFGVLDRPFDLVFDWTFLGSGFGFLKASIGSAGATAVAVGAGLLAAGLVVLVTLSVVRLSRIVVAHRTGATRTVVALGLVWVVCAVLGVQIVARVPVAAHGYYDRLVQVGVSLRDRDEFAAEVAVDAFRDTPSADLLTGLRGKDVLLVFVESYGRVALEDPSMAPQIEALLDAGNRRLSTVGYSARSGYLTSPTAGGGSWLAHATLLAGVWVDNQQRHRDLFETNRFTLTGAFHRAGWRTVAVMPGVSGTWPEGAFFSYDRLYTVPDLGYRGPTYAFQTMPDQYTLSAFQRFERASAHGPVMAEIPLISSHAPWSPVPPFVDWDDVGDGSAFPTVEGAGDPATIVLQRDQARVKDDFRLSIEYSLNTLLSYVEKYGDDDLVVVFLGDHQPSPVVAGDGASRDAPITILARDPAVLDRVNGWGWTPGLRPDARAPVWRMDAFRDRFLTAFGP